jgi:RimJ/RimL family protein N-acetyltransferase
MCLHTATPTQKQAHRLSVHTTGVSRAHRGLGVALALKLEGIRWGQRQGFHEIMTSNHSRNAAMLHINSRLGFVRAPATIEYREVFE